MRSPRVPWWPGSVVSEDGVHVHHLFFGIVLMMVAGALSFAAGETDGPWYAIYAVLFGIGLGLTIDEYALWLHLEDVYWSREGRSSIDATLVALGLIAFVLLAFVRRPAKQARARATVPGRPPDGSVQGAPARRNRWGRGGGVPSAACRGDPHGKHLGGRTSERTSGTQPSRAWVAAEMVLAPAVAASMPWRE